MFVGLYWAQRDPTGAERGEFAEAGAQADVSFTIWCFRAQDFRCFGVLGF